VRAARMLLVEACFRLRVNPIIPNIMRTFKLRHVVTACVAVYATSLSVLAQQSAADTPQPRLEKLEETEVPTITVDQPDRPRSSTIETRAPGGRVTEVQVTSGNSTYYLRPNSQYGSSMPGEGEASSFRAPQWQIMQFDRGRSVNEKEAEAARAATVPPPPSMQRAPDQK
jgi:hypothetical protein